MAMEFLLRASSKTDPKIDLEKRTVSSSFASDDHSVMRYFWGEDLPKGGSRYFEEYISCEPKHWNLTRVENSACPYLKNHDRNQQLGKVLDVSFSNGKAYATRGILRTQAGDEYLGAVEDNLQTGESFGYLVHKYELIEAATYEENEFGRPVLKTHAKMRAIDIELYEVSSEAIPADPSVGLGSKDQPLVLSRSVIDAMNIQEQLEVDLMPTDTSKKGIAEDFKDTSEDLALQLKEAQTALSQRDQDLAQKDQELETLRSENASLAQNNQKLGDRMTALETKANVTDRYASLRIQAEDLRQKGQLSPSTFNRYFGNSSEDITRYCEKTHLLDIVVDVLEDASGNPVQSALRTQAFFKPTEADKPDPREERRARKQAAFSGR